MYENEIYHHGIKGMKWGVRRFQFKDGSLTGAGRKRYSEAEQNYRDAKAARKQANREHRKAFNKASTLTGAYGKHRAQYNRESIEAAKKANKADEAYQKAKKAREEYYKTPEGKKELAAKRQKAIKVGAAVAGTALAAYGAYKVNQYVKTKNCEIAAQNGYKSAKRYFDMQMRSMIDNPQLMGVKGSLKVDAGAEATSWARTASKDNFRTAAKNVYRYKKAGNSLDSLRSVNSYRNSTPFEVAWDKRKK